MIGGPNTALGNTSVLFMVECGVAYITKVIIFMKYLYE
jgi:hypothetical protein